jgi:hypothetical protein
MQGERADISDRKIFCGTNRRNIKEKSIYPDVLEKNLCIKLLKKLSQNYGCSRLCAIGANSFVPRGVEHPRKEIRKQRRCTCDALQETAFRIDVTLSIRVLVSFCMCAQKYSIPRNQSANSPDHVGVLFIKGIKKV